MFFEFRFNLKKDAAYLSASKQKHPHTHTLQLVVVVVARWFN